MPNLKKPEDFEIYEYSAKDTVQQLRKILEKGYLLHGSWTRISDALQPKKAADLSGVPYKNLVGVYATDQLHTAVAAALLQPKPEANRMVATWGGDTTHFEISGNDSVVLAPGYIYVVPSDTFVRHDGDDGYYEMVSPKAVQPICGYDVGPAILDELPYVVTKLPKVYERM